MKWQLQPEANGTVLTTVEGDLGTINEAWSQSRLDGGQEDMLEECQSQMLAAAGSGEFS